MVPTEPNIQESSGRPGPVRTYQDLLNNPHDENLFDYYATAQLAFVDSDGGKINQIGQPAIFETVDPAPDGKHIFVARIIVPIRTCTRSRIFPKRSKSGRQQ